MIQCNVKWFDRETNGLQLLALKPLKIQEWNGRHVGEGGGGGLRGSNEPPFQLNDGALKTQVVDFQLFFSGGMENELWVF